MSWISKKRILIPVLVVVSGLAACGDEKGTLPLADVEVRIETGRFFPKDLDLRPGNTVRWVNILPRSPENIRTVTSGAPEDSVTGTLFDSGDLQGRESGEVEGDDFIFKFTERGTYPFFSRYPAGNELRGTVLVR